MQRQCANLMGRLQMLQEVCILLLWLAKEEHESCWGHAVMCREDAGVPGVEGG